MLGVLHKVAVQSVSAVLAESRAQQSLAFFDNRKQPQQTKTCNAHLYYLH